MNILVTGGCGFIGSAFIRQLFESAPKAQCVNLDSLTYAGNPYNLSSIENFSGYTFVHDTILNKQCIRELLHQHCPQAVVHFAAESHVDRSIDGPEAFLQTNVMGTACLLQEALHYWTSLPVSKKTAFRFLHVSTDEVFGDLGQNDPAFTEKTPYAPNSPYSASKAASDHLVRAYSHTYGLPAMISNCSNNYGPYQFPEKLIPLMITQALEEKPLPVYGTGENVRDWLHVDDHCRALFTILNNGTPGESYVIGGNSEMKNIDLVHLLCDHLDTLKPRSNGESYTDLITFVTDRKGHDRRYAIDSTKIQQQLGWKPQHAFSKGLLDTIRWYLNNKTWCENIENGTYQNTVDKKG